MKIKEYRQPEDLKEAYQLIKDYKNALLVAGGAYLRLQNREIPLAIDLSGLGLDYIIEEDQYLKIGAMTTLRSIEVDDYCNSQISGILSKMVKQIGSLQLRNIVTIGGSICGKYSFSDLLPTLIVLNATLRFYKVGEISIDEFLAEDQKNDILLEIIIDLDQKARVKYLKKTYKEYSLINVALARKEEEYRIAIGARPGRGAYAKLASKILTTEKDIEKACEILIEELTFNDDYRVSGDYRKSIAQSLLKEAYKEMVV
jgi:CO/xanthine dehydrogenase FAD-binding subunit